MDDELTINYIKLKRYTHPHNGKKKNYVYTENRNCRQFVDPVVLVLHHPRTMVFQQIFFLKYN